MHIYPSIRKYSPFSLISYIDSDLPDHQNERLPQWLSGKESAGNAGATGDTGVIPVLGRLPGEGNGNPLQYSGLDQWTEGPEGLQSMGLQSQIRLSD